MTAQIVLRYNQLCASKSDINEHLPTLKSYAEKCQTVAEFGVRSVVSTWALLAGLAASKEAGPKRLDCVDIEPVDMVVVAAIAAEAQIELIFQRADSVKANLPAGVDMLFIDSWHVYGHLKRELAAHHAHVRKFIAMHDTEIDGVRGQSIRVYSAAEYSKAIARDASQYGYTVDEVAAGLRPAINEFIAEHPEWVIDRIDTNNNGLTVLRRIA